MARHLITGGAVFIGSALARRLVDEGHEVQVLDRFSRGKQDRLPKEVLCVKGDICRRSAVMQAVWGCDVVWHLAYVQGTQTFYADPRDVITVALKGIMSVLESCQAQEKPPEFFLVIDLATDLERIVGGFMVEDEKRVIGSGARQTVR